MKKYIILIVLVLIVSVCVAATRNIVPRSDNEGGIGTTSKNWATGYFTLLDGDTLTEGGNAVYSSGETPGGELGGTFASFTIDDSLAVSNWNLTTPTITTGITITGADHNPAVAGEIRYDTTITGIMSGGGLRWFDDDSVRLLVDLETDPSNDDYVVAYDSAADGFYMKADADTVGSTAYNSIGDPTGAGSIGFDDTETAIYTTVQDTAGSFFSLINSNADVSNQVYMLDIDYSADTTQDNADFIRLQDAGSTLIVFEEEGKITMTPSGVDDAIIISMIPSTALTAADAAWYGIKIDGDALDPGAVDNRILGVAVDLSGVGLTNDPYVRALDLKMFTGGVAIDIEEGEIHQDFTADSNAGAEYTSYDVVIHAENLNAASTIHAIDIALSAGDPAGDVYALGTHSFIGPVKQSIGVYTTQDNLELQGRKTGGGDSWVDDVDGQECFVANADEVYLGDDAATGAQFNEIQVIMGTPGTRSVNPTFWYNTAADAWTEFFPADDTLGFKQSGLIRWTLADISGSWTNDGDPGVGESTAGWWIKIIRNENPDPGTPTPTTAKTGVITDCTWSKTGALNVVSLEAATITDGTLSITGGEILDATTLEATTTLGIEIGDVQQLVLTDGKLNPTTDDDIDLGDATHQFKDAFFDGTLEADAITEGGNAVSNDTEIEAVVEPLIDTLANLTSIQSLTVTLADAGTDAFFGWDDGASAYENLTNAEAEAIMEPLIDTLANLSSVGGQPIAFADAGTDAFFGWDDAGGAQYENLTAAEAMTIIGGAATDLDGSGNVAWGNVAAGELGNDSVINEDIDDDGGFVFTGAWDFGGGDLEIPQASPGVPAADGGIEMDFTDGALVMQHGAAHAELGASTDVVVAKLIRSFEGTFATPDGLQSEIDNWIFKRIDATEFPHGIVITSITLTVSGDTSYAINVENWDDHDTINGGDPTIDAVSYTAPSTGEVTESTITYATIAAGQIIQIDLPTTDVSWISIKIEYYEPAA